MVSNQLFFSNINLRWVFGVSLRILQTYYEKNMLNTYFEAVLSVCNTFLVSITTYLSLHQTRIRGLLTLQVWVKFAEVLYEQLKREIDKNP